MGSSTADRSLPLNQYVQKLVNDKQFSGVSWRVDYKGQPVLHDYCGFQADDGQRLVQQDTIFRLYSMTKPIVAVRCLQLVESGVIRLTDPIDRWLPEFSSQTVLLTNGQTAERKRPITVEDLLMHRSGLSYDFLPNCPVASLYREADLAANGRRSLTELVSVLATLPLSSQPGDRWHYSYATDVLAGLIEKVADKPLADELRNHLFDPLGMSETRFYVPEQDQYRLAQMFGQRELGQVDHGEFTRNQLQVMDVETSYPCQQSRQFCRGGIGLFSTLNDYSIFAQALLNGTYQGTRMLSVPMVEMLWQNRLLSQQMPITIGLHEFPGYGWGFIGRVMSEPHQAMTLTSSGEGGWSGAASTYFWVDRQKQLTGVVMAQYLGTTVPIGTDIQTLAYAAIGA